MKKFEYLKISDNMYEHNLNLLGQEGWQLISHVVSFKDYFVKIEDWVFMREISEDNSHCESDRIKNKK